MGRHIRGETVPGLAPAMTRRTFLSAAGGAVALGALSPLPLRGATPPAVTPSVAKALRALGRTTLRVPGSLPDPALAAGTDTLPGIEHIVVLMLENHSYDNLLGMLGRGPGQRPLGDAFPLAGAALPPAPTPSGEGRTQHASHMPPPCQLPGPPSQEWTASH